MVFFIDFFYCFLGKVVVVGFVCCVYEVLNFVEEELYINVFFVSDEFNFLLE